GPAASTMRSRSSRIPLRRVPVPQVPLRRVPVPRVPVPQVPVRHDRQHTAPLRLGGAQRPEGAPPTRLGARGGDELLGPEYSHRAGELLDRDERPPIRTTGTGRVLWLHFRSPRRLRRLVESQVYELRAPARRVPVEKVV